MVIKKSDNRIVSVDPLDKINEMMSSMDDKLPVELFSDERSNSDGIALKTDLIHKEHVLVSVLATENELIKNDLKIDLYGEFLKQFRRHKVSLDRLSRKEFVSTVQGGISDKDLDVASNIQNLMESRK